MKKIVASVGLAAIGASAIQTASAQIVDVPDSTKPWSVAGTLRGFYDDNTATLSDASLDAFKAQHPSSTRGSAGFEISPSLGLKWAPGQTDITLGYIYSIKYYDNKPPGNADHTDQSHNFSAALNHAINERMKLSATDSFVIGQEPDLLRTGSTMSTFQRVSGDNIRNYGTLGFDAEITPVFGMSVNYENGYYDYSQDEITTDSAGNVLVYSTAGALNRDENTFHLEGNWLLKPETKGLLGYRFRNIAYLADQTISGNVVTHVNEVTSSDRNSRAHTPYVGLQHAFRPDLTASVRAGASYNDYYNSSTSSSDWSPYVQISMRYLYATESTAEIGFSYDRNATDVVNNFNINNYTTDAESATLYGSVRHRFTPKLFGSLTAQFQNSMYNGGTNDGESEQYYLLGLEFQYRFNQHVSAHLGYNYDQLASNLSGLDRGYDRNRVYMGVTASY